MNQPHFCIQQEVNGDCHFSDYEKKRQKPEFQKAKFQNHKNFYENEDVFDKKQPVKKLVSDGSEHQKRENTILIEIKITKK